MKLIAIWAEDMGGVIGRGYALPWENRADMRHFRDTTAGHTILMGYRTWLSIDQTPLPGRRNVVISREPIDGVETYANIQDALQSLSDQETVYLIGGAATIEAAYPHLDGYIRSRILNRYEGDVKAPRLPKVEPDRVVHLYDTHDDEGVTVEYVTLKK